MSTVEFIIDVTPYRRGEVAGFTDQLARRLVEKGLAQPVKVSRHAHVPLANFGPRRRPEPPLGFRVPERTGDD